ncbi:hypothetical protein CE195_03745 [Sodalis-like symbiont of Philaenus spumarius]|nr:hypothetical protein CE195_03745 [Sodalis-like symbiont of Philaenus spumarius]
MHTTFQPGQIPLITAIKALIMRVVTRINITPFFVIMMLVMMEVDTLYMGSEAKIPVIQVTIIT